MKQKIMMTIFFSLFLSSAGFHARAQTKEETISWLKEKLAGHIYVDDDWHIKDLEVSPCEISWTEESDEEYEHGHSYFFCSFNPALAGSWSSERNTLILAQASIVYSRNYSGTIGSYVEHGASVFIIKEGEEGIAEEMAKKLNHLATFCDEGKKEAN